MKLGFLATLTALVVGHVSASPIEDVLTPSGIPATSGLPLTSIPFISPTANASTLSALSSLISSESTALYPLTATLTAPATSVSTPTTTPSATAPTSSTGAARRLGLGSSDLVTGASLALGVIAVLVCS